MLALQRELDEANVEFEKEAAITEKAYQEARKLGGSFKEALAAVGGPGLEDASDKIVSRISDIERRIVYTPAQSFVGLAMKLRIAREAICPGHYEVDEVAIISACRDAERLARTA